MNKYQKTLWRDAICRAVYDAREGSKYEEFLYEWFKALWRKGGEMRPSLVG